MAAEILLHFSKLWKKGGQKGEGGGGADRLNISPSSSSCIILLMVEPWRGRGGTPS